MVATLHRHYIVFLLFSLIGMQPLGTQVFFGNSRSGATHSAPTLSFLPPSSAVNDSYVMGDLSCSPSVENVDGLNFPSYISFCGTKCS